MPSRIGETTAFDPYASAVAPAIVATFNDYARSELGVVSELKYELSAGLYKDWDLGHVQPDSNGRKIPYPNVLPDLSYAMTMNPKMKVLIQQGYYDLACPYGTVKAAVDHLNDHAGAAQERAHRVLRSGPHDVRAPGLDEEVRRHDQGVHRRELELSSGSARCERSAVAFGMLGQQAHHPAGCARPSPRDQSSRSECSCACGAWDLAR